MDDKLVPFMALLSAVLLLNPWGPPKRDAARPDPTP